jgi:hypothetical protein
MGTESLRTPATAALSADKWKLKRSPNRVELQFGDELRFGDGGGKQWNRTLE